MSETVTEKCGRCNDSLIDPYDGKECGRCGGMPRIAFDRSKLESLTRTLHAIAITLGLETWEDLPAGDTDAVLLAVQRNLSARKLADYQRGLEAARVSLGAAAVDLPVGLNELYEEWVAAKGGYHETKPELRAAYTVGAESFRDFLKERKIQSGKFQAVWPEGRFVNADKDPGTAYELGRYDLDGAVQRERERCVQIALEEKVDAAATGQEGDYAYNRACDDIAAAIRGGALPKEKHEPPMEGMSERERLIRHGFCFDSDRDCDAAKYLLGVIDVIREDRNWLREKFEVKEPEFCQTCGWDINKAAICTSPSGKHSLDGGFTFTAGTEQRCSSLHGGQQCQWIAGHDGPHQEGKEVWSHA